MPDVTVCVNATSNLWQFRVGASKVEVLLYSKHDVQGLIHDLDTFIFKIELRPIIYSWVKGLAYLSYLSNNLDQVII